jgi:hypothetical protein
MVKKVLIALNDKDLYEVSIRSNVSATEIWTKLNKVTMRYTFLSDTFTENQI